MSESRSVLVPTEAIHERPPWAEWYCLQFTYELLGGTILGLGTMLGLSLALCPAIFYPLVNLFFKEVMLAIVSIQMFGFAAMCFSEIFAPGGRLAIWVERADLAVIEKGLLENTSVDAAKNITRLLWVKPKLKPSAVRTLSGFSDRYGSLLSLSPDETCLHVASANGLIKLLKKILKANPDVNVTCGNGTTALHLASRFGHTKIVELLLKKGADVNLADRDGLSALHYAAQAGYRDCAIVLLKNGADRGALDSAGKSPLDVTRDRGVALALNSDGSFMHRLLTTIKSTAGQARSTFR